MLDVEAADPITSARRAAAALPCGGVLYYALGGGLGHLTRAAALARAWSRINPEPFVTLTNCRITVPVEGPVLRLRQTEPEPAALGRLVSELAAGLRTEVLGVDAFPAGILGELPAFLDGLRCGRLAVLRRLQERWLEHWSVPRLLAEHYDTAVAVESGVSGLTEDETAPVLIRDAAELLPPEAARQALAAGPDDKVLLVSVSGTRPADQGLIQLCVRLGERHGAAVRVVTPFPQGSLPGTHLAHYPLLEWLRGADLVVGPSGYNLFHEAAAVGVPAIWVPQPRQYDDQFARAARARRARSPEELEQHIQEALTLPRLPSPTYHNGALEVCRLLRSVAHARA